MSGQQTQKPTLPTTLSEANFSRDPRLCTTATQQLASKLLRNNQTMTSRPVCHVWQTCLRHVWACSSVLFAPCISRQPRQTVGRYQACQASNVSFPGRGTGDKKAGGSSLLLAFVSSKIRLASAELLSLFFASLKLALLAFVQPNV